MTPVLEAGLKFGQVRRETVAHRNLGRNVMCGGDDRERRQGKKRRWRHAALPQEVTEQESHAGLPLANVVWKPNSQSPELSAQSVSVATALATKSG